MKKIVIVVLITMLAFSILPAVTIAPKEGKAIASENIEATMHLRASFSAGVTSIPLASADQPSTEFPGALQFNNGRKIAVVPEGLPDAGTICVVWVKNKANWGGEIWYAESIDGGTTWINVQCISGSLLESRHPAIAISPDGTRCVVWSDHWAICCEDLYFNYRTSSGNWQSPIKIFTAGYEEYYRSPSIIIDSNCKIHISIIWQYSEMTPGLPDYGSLDYLGFYISDISSASFPGAFTTTLLYGAYYYFYSSAIATDGSSHPLIVWWGEHDPQFGTPVFSEGIYYYFYDGTNWIPPLNNPSALQPIELGGKWPALCGSGGNIFYGVWQLSSTVRFSTYDGSSNIWSGIESVNSGNYPVVAALNSNIIVAWENGNEIYCSKRSGPNSWSSPIIVSNFPPGQNSVSPHIVISPEDNYVYAIWLEGNAAPYEIKFRKIRKSEDVFIRDCPDDDGSVPSWDANHNGIWDGIPPDREYWVSPDILVDLPSNNGIYDGIPGESGEENPVRGKECHLYAYVHNIGIQPATNVLVNFYWADYSVGCPPWNLTNFHYIDGFLITSLAPGQTEDDQYITWNVPSNIPKHTCIWVRLDCGSDPIINNDPGWENNIGWRNFWIESSKEIVIDGQVFYETSIDFKVINPGNTTADVYVNLFLEHWPRAWTFESTSPDPSFHSVEVPSFAGYVNKYIFSSMKPKEVGNVTLKITAPEGTENDTGTIHIAGTIDNRPIGGISVQVAPPHLVIHNIAVTNVTSTKTVVEYGHSTSLNVTVENQGNCDESFDVTVYANTTIIQTKTITLTSGSSTTLTFTWNTTGFAAGNYTISAYASPVPGETDTADNTFVNSSVIVNVCFIATAAYGTPMAPQIQVLRDFRDQYLLTNPVGEALVELYYKVSPPMAEFITEHPSLKPIVRAGLLPAVAMSVIAVNTTPAEKAAIVGLVVLVAAALAIWATRRRGRGPKYSCR